MLEIILPQLIRRGTEVFGRYAARMHERTLELLTYDFKVDDEVHDFSEANPWTGRLGDFECRLPDQRLEARPIPASPARRRGELCWSRSCWRGSCEANAYPLDGDH